MRDSLPIHVIVEVLAETVVSMELRARLEEAGVPRADPERTRRRRRRTT